MRAVQVLAADGTAWTVRVEWLPRWRALARRTGGWRRKGRGGDDVGADVGLEVFDAGWTVETAPTLARGGSGPGPAGSSGGGGGGFDLGGDDLPVVVVLGLALLAVGAVALLGWFVVLPAFLLVLDGLVVAVLLVGGTLGRVLLRRPWTVAATTAGGHRVTRPVVGWRAALRRRDEVVALLRAGRADVGTRP